MVGIRDMMIPAVILTLIVRQTLPAPRAVHALQTTKRVTHQRAPARVARTRALQVEAAEPAQARTRTREWVVRRARQAA